MEQSWLSRRSLSSFGVHISVALVLLLKMSMVSSMSEDYYNPDYDEVVSGGLAEGNWGKIEDGAGLSQFLDERELVGEPGKRHLGSLAASGAAGSKLGLRLGQLLPSQGNEMGKRHLGSVAAAAGLGPRLGLRLGQSSYGRDGMMAKRHLGSVAAVSGIRPRVIKSYSNFNPDLNDHEVNPSISALESRFPINDFNLNENEPGAESSAESPKRAEFVDEQTLLKGKRFLGSMARGGWFPRQFRGFIEQPMGKRHIGAVARLGWIPYSKLNRLEEGGEGSFKRNVQSLRKNSVARPGGN